MDNPYPNTSPLKIQFLPNIKSQDHVPVGSKSTDVLKNIISGPELIKKKYTYVIDRYLYQLLDSIIIARKICISPAMDVKCGN